MRKFLTALLTLLIVLSAFGCTKPPVEENNDEDAARFKTEYESLNKTEDNKYREVSINVKNPFYYATVEQIVEKMDKEETFMVYFGANWCPWCRSIIENVIAKAAEMGITKIYYVDVRPDNDQEKEIRDVYDLDENGKVYLKHAGTDGYHDFINRAASVLVDYNHGKVTTLDGTEFAGAKRVGAPNYVLVRKGVAIERITGVSSYQSSPMAELTDEINEDVKKIFTRFFQDYLDIVKK